MNKSVRVDVLALVCVQVELAKTVEVDLLEQRPVGLDVD